LNFLDRFSKNPNILNLMKIRPVGAEISHADRQTGTHDEANSGLLKFCEGAYKFISCRQRNPGSAGRSAKAMRCLGSRADDGALLQFA
jgi:hypothetical protein